MIYVFKIIPSQFFPIFADFNWTNTALFNIKLLSYGLKLWSLQNSPLDNITYFILQFINGSYISNENLKEEKWYTS